MLNLLIIDPNINNSKHLLNYLSQNNYQVRVHSIANNLQEGLQILNMGIIDITLINTNTDPQSIVQNLHTISDIYYEKYKKSVILISNNIVSNFSDIYVYDIISPNENINTILSKINELAKNKALQLNRTILMNKINKELEYIGYNLSYNGTKYLSECIALIYSTSGCCENLNKNVYPIIAKKYQKTINNIKCKITSATNSMFYECDENRLKNYFQFYTISRPKPKLVIYTILNKIQ